MFKLLVSSLFVVACVHCRNVPVSVGAPYYPQQYYPQAYAIQPKYSAVPSAPYVASPYYSGSYVRQGFLPANPAYNPYLYGAYPAFPQQYPYFPNDGTQGAENAGAEGTSYIDYFNYYWNNYVPSFSNLYGSSETTSVESSQQATASSEGTSANAENGDKPTDGLKSDIQNPANQQPAQYPYRPFAAPQLFYFGQPQFYGQYQQPAYNGAISNYLLNQPQQYLGQRFYQAPQYQVPGSAALAYQKYLQYQKQNGQQGLLQVQQDASSVAVDSTTSQPENNDQQAQTKVASDPTKAVAEPVGVAFAGIGGQAGAGPVGTAIVGKNATAVADPKATAISIDETPSFNIIPVHKMTSAYIAKYTPESGVYKVVEIK